MRTSCRFYQKTENVLSNKESIGKIAIWCQFHIFFKWKFCEEKTIITWFWLAQCHPR